MKKTLILTPNKNPMCGMWQLAKELAREFNAEIGTKKDKPPSGDYDKVITFLYPMHKIGQKLKEYDDVKWIVYDQKVPPITKLNFPNFFRRQYMKWFSYANDKSMRGADEYWELSEREQKPKWTKKMNYVPNPLIPYACYIGRRTDYKNFDWLNKTMESLAIPFIPSKPKSTDDDICRLLSNAKLFVTASTWEGYGRPVMEAQALGIPTVCFDTGTHKKHMKKGIVVPNGDFREFKRAIKIVWGK